MADTTQFETPNYGLPLLEGEYIPSWLVDWNTAFTKVDTALHELNEKIGTGGGVTVDTSITATGTNPVTGKAIYDSQEAQNLLITALQTNIGTLTTANQQKDTLINNLQTSVSNLTTEQQDLIRRIEELEARP